MTIESVNTYTLEGRKKAMTIERMYYETYSDYYSDYETVPNSYDPYTTTIDVIIPSDRA